MDLTQPVVDMEGIGEEICDSLNIWRKPDVYQDKGASWKQPTQTERLDWEENITVGVGEELLTEEKLFTRCSFLYGGLNPGQLH